MRALRIGAVLDQPRLVAQPHEHRVEPRETFGIGVQRDRAGEIDERPWHREGGGFGGGRGRIGGAGEEIGDRIADLPVGILGGDAGDRQRPGGGAPTVEIILVVEADRGHAATLGRRGEVDEVDAVGVGRGVIRAMRREGAGSGVAFAAYRCKEAAKRRRNAFFGRFCACWSRMDFAAGRRVSGGPFDPRVAAW